MLKLNYPNTEQSKNCFVWKTVFLAFRVKEKKKHWNDVYFSRKLLLRSNTIFFYFFYCFPDKIIGLISSSLFIFSTNSPCCYSFHIIFTGLLLLHHFGRWFFLLSSSRVSLPVAWCLHLKKPSTFLFRVEISSKFQALIEIKHFTPTLWEPVRWAVSGSHWTWLLRWLYSRSSGLLTAYTVSHFPEKNKDMCSKQQNQEKGK